jgi:hypothetical protein
MDIIKRIKSTAMNKGKARVWVEGDLSAYGFERGTPITITVLQGGIQITVDSNGKRIMAGRTNKNTGKSIQILDICMPNSEREAIRCGAAKFTVYARVGQIWIRPDMSTVGAV